MNFSPGTVVRSFESTLPQDPGKPIVLKASEGPWTESWTLDPANIWRFRTVGLAPVHNLSPQGVLNPVWRPWPGEELTIEVERPEPIPGQYLVVDEVELSTTAGRENRRHSLSLWLRSSRGGTHSIYLPAGSEIGTLALDGRTIPVLSPPVRDRGLEIQIPLSPGDHRVNVDFLENVPIAARFTTPAVDLALPFANASYAADLPQDRWILYTGGPVMGPAVLFWSFAGAMLVLALLLSRTRLAPLRTVSWWLILVGLSQLSLAGAFVVAAWLLLLGLRGSRPPLSRPVLFNLAQLLLVLWTAAALILIYQGLQYALMSAPSMRVAGAGSYGHHLEWMVDRSDGPLPPAWALTISDKVYQYIMLAWALWLAIGIIRWLRWGWRCFSAETFWKRLPRRPKFPPPPVPGFPGVPPGAGGPPPGWPPAGGPPSGWPAPGGPPPDGSAPDETPSGWPPPDEAPPDGASPYGTPAGWPPPDGALPDGTPSDGTPSDGPASDDPAAP